MTNETTSVADPLVKGLLAKIDAVRSTGNDDYVFLGTEVALARDFGISRMTVRRALDDLVSQGLIVRRRAKGIFLPPPSSIQRTLKFLVPSLLHDSCIQYLKGIQSATENRNYSIEIHDANSDYEHAIELLDQLPRNPAAGAIIVAINHPTFLQKLIDLQRKGHPFVVLGNLANVIDASMVTDTHKESSYEMACDLIAKGHRRIGHIGQFRSPTNTELWQGLQAALNDEGFALPSSYRVQIPEDIDPLSDWTPAIHAATRQLMEMEAPPTAILYHDDRAALIACKWFRKNGYRLPHDMSIIGVGDSELGHFASPELSTIQQPHYLAGKEAVHMLEQLMERPSTKPRQTILQSKWICRDSVIPYSGN